MSWLEPAGGGQRLRFATWSNGGWSAPGTVTEGSDWLINWADFPSVVPGNPWSAHWLIRQGDVRYAYDVATAVSSDLGEQWSTPRLLHDDATASEHGFVSLLPLTGSRSARVLAVWLDGRNTVQADGSMTLRSATLDAEGRISNPLLVDERVCDCCQTDLTLTDSGPVVVYRNRSAEEIRDIFVSRLTADGWSPGIPVAEDGWHISGCPVNGPAIAARGQRVAVAWYTGAGNQPRIRAAFSLDGARTFAAPIDIATGPVMGRVDVALSGDGAFVSWLENVRSSAGVTAEIRARRVGQDGELGQVMVAGSSGTGRPAGFPQMVVVDGQLLFAWTDTRGAEPEVVSARLKIL